MRAGPVESLRQLLHVDFVGNLERGLAHGVLALVTVLAKADRPAVAWLAAHRSIGSRADMSGFDGRLGATGAAGMACYPFPMGWTTLPRILTVRFVFNSGGEFYHTCFQTLPRRIAQMSDFETPY